MNELFDYFIIFVFSSIFLLGWLIALLCYSKNKKLAGTTFFILWLTYFSRFHLLSLTLEFMFGENFQTSIIGKSLWLFQDLITSCIVLFVFVLIFYIPYGIVKKQFGHVLVTLFLIFPLHFSYTESYFIFYPLIDTAKSPKFTLNRFDMIQPGMTREQVKELIGEPIENAGQYDTPCEGQTGDGAAPHPYDFAWLNSSICYDDLGYVANTKKMWIPD